LLLAYRVARAVEGSTFSISGHLTVWGVPWYAHVAVDLVSLVWLAGGLMGALRSSSFLFFRLHLVPLVEAVFVCLAPRAPALRLAAVTVLLIPWDRTRARVALLQRLARRFPAWTLRASRDHCDHPAGVDPAPFFARPLSATATLLGVAVAAFAVFAASPRSIWAVLLVPDILLWLWAVAAPGTPSAGALFLAPVPQPFELANPGDVPARRAPRAPSPLDELLSP